MSSNHCNMTPEYISLYYILTRCIDIILHSSLFSFDSHKLRSKYVTGATNDDHIEVVNENKYEMIKIENLCKLYKKYQFVNISTAYFALSILLQMIT